MCRATLSRDYIPYDYSHRFADRKEVNIENVERRLAAELFVNRLHISTAVAITN